MNKIIIDGYYKEKECLGKISGIIFKNWEDNEFQLLLTISILIFLENFIKENFLGL
mgnify:CR=1 FL=1